MAKRILIVDDEPDQITTVGAVLEELDYDIQGAQSVEEAEAAVQANKPDLIILDVMMGELDSGIQLCQKLKGAPDTKDIPIIMVTGIREKMGMSFSPDSDGDYLPADAYMEKPVHPQDLIERVKKLLS